MSCWHKDSICISMYDWHAVGFESLVAEVVDKYDPYGYTAITKDQWNTIFQKANTVGGELWTAVSEAAVWAEQNYLRHKVFTVLGM